MKGLGWFLRDLRGWNLRQACREYSYLGRPQVAK
jgi:hypothetical protein